MKTVKKRQTKFVIIPQIDKGKIIDAFQVSKKEFGSATDYADKAYHGLPVSGQTKFPALSAPLETETYKDYYLRNTSTAIMLENKYERELDLMPLPDRYKAGNGIDETSLRLLGS